MIPNCHLVPGGRSVCLSVSLWVCLSHGNFVDYLSPKISLVWVFLLEKDIFREVFHPALFLRQASFLNVWTSLPDENTRFQLTASASLVSLLACWRPLVGPWSVHSCVYGIQWSRGARGWSPSCSPKSAPQSFSFPMSHVSSAHWGWILNI